MDVAGADMWALAKSACVPFKARECNSYVVLIIKSRQNVCCILRKHLKCQISSTFERDIQKPYVAKL